MRSLSFLASLFFLTFLRSWALMPVANTDTDTAGISNNAMAFSHLQFQASKNDLELKIAQSKLDKLKVDQQINELTGTQSNGLSGDLKLALMQVMSFNGRSGAEISLYGQTKVFHEGDQLMDGFVLDSINASSIEVNNTKTNQKARYIVSSKAINTTNYM